MTSKLVKAIKNDDIEMIKNELKSITDFGDLIYITTWAVKNDCTKAALFLINMISDSNENKYKKNKDYFSFLLCFAARNGNVNIIEMLLSKGADAHIYGGVPFRWAEKYGHTKIMEILENV